MCPCPCQGLHLVEEIKFPPQQLLPNTRWTSSIPGPSSTLPLCCCVTLGKQLTLSESLFLPRTSKVWTLWSKVLSSQAINSLGSVEDEEEHGEEKEGRMRAGFPTGQGSPHLSPKDGSS